MAAWNGQHQVGADPRRALAVLPPGAYSPILLSFKLP